MKNNLAVGKWHKIIKETRLEAERELVIKVVGAKAQTQAWLDFLGPGAGSVFSVATEGEPLGGADLIVLVAAGAGVIDGQLAGAAKVAAKTGLEVIALIDAAGLNQAARQAKVAEAELALSLAPARISFFSAQSSREERAALLKAIAGLIGDKGVALAARVATFRPAVVTGIIREVASQNAVIGAAGFIPAADLPVLTANQIRMVLKIAAAHGMTISLKRAKEILVVVGGGFTFRAIARQIVGLVPIAGWAVKGAVAYTGTRALGDLAAKYFSGLEEPD